MRFRTQLFCSCLIVISANPLFGKEDKPSWIGVPAADLELHSVLTKMVVVNTFNSAGSEFRIYTAKKNIDKCIPSKTILSQAQWARFRECSGKIRGCDYFFALSDGVVSSFKVVGRCSPFSKSVLPE